MLSRELIVDACGLINLFAADSAEACLEHIDPQPQMTPSVERECGAKPAAATALRELVDAGLLERFVGEVSADQLVAFMTDHDLGQGESEAILACAQVGRHLWSDDRRARNVANQVLGGASVTGTIGILQALVRLGDMTPERAFEAYSTMRAKGGFLPQMTLADFPAGA